MMDDDLQAPEAFHRFAVDHHIGRLVEACREAQVGRMTDDVRLAAADAVSWAVRLHDDVLKKRRFLPREFVEGSRWARHRIVHGDVTLLGFALVSEIDNSWKSADIWHVLGPADPETSWQGTVAVTARFERVEAEVDGDQQRKLRPLYNEWVAGRRVVTVCHLLRGGWTMGTPFAQPDEG